MSIAAWDGRTLAVDKMAVNGDHVFMTTKARRLADGTVVAWTGCESAGRGMAKWFENGADPEKYPKEQRDDNLWSRLIVVRPDRTVIYYESLAEPLTVEDDFFAWGSGRDFALGAMAMGADARRAVEIASQLCATCGMGIDVFEFEPTPETSLATVRSNGKVHI